MDEIMMKSKISSVLSDIASDDMVKLTSLSKSHPEIIPVVNKLREELTDFNRQYYRPESQNIKSLYDRVLSFETYVGYTVNDIKRKYNAERKRKYKKPKIKRIKKCKCKK